MGRRSSAIRLVMPPRAPSPRALLSRNHARDCRKFPPVHCRSTDGKPPLGTPARLEPRPPHPDTPLPPSRANNRVLGQIGEPSAPIFSGKPSISPSTLQFRPWRSRAKRAARRGATTPLEQQPPLPFHARHFDVVQSSRRDCRDAPERCGSAIHAHCTGWGEEGGGCVAHDKVARQGVYRPHASRLGVGGQREVRAEGADKFAQSPAQPSADRMVRGMGGTARHLSQSGGPADDAVLDVGMWGRATHGLACLVTQMTKHMAMAPRTK